MATPACSSRCWCFESKAGRPTPDEISDMVSKERNIHSAVIGVDRKINLTFTPGRFPVTRRCDESVFEVVTPRLYQIYDSNF